MLLLQRNGRFQARPRLVFALLSMPIGLALPLTALAADGHFERDLTVSPQVVLSVSSGSGDILVRTGSDTKIHISAHVHSSNSLRGSSAQERVQAVVSNPPIQQSGDQVWIGAEPRYENVSIDYEITAPKTAKISAQSGSGDITLDRVGKDASLHTGSGTISATATTGTVDAKAGSGDIHIDSSSLLDVIAKSGSGAIEVKGASAGLIAQTGSGDIIISGKPGSGWNITTGSGDVTLNLNGSPLHLQASTGSGEIYSKTPMLTQGSLLRNHIEGTIGTGGPNVHVQTGSGDIEIR